MPSGNPDEPDNELPPPGRRWGVGVDSVLPYLARSLQAKPAPSADALKGKPGPPANQGERGAGGRR